MENRSIAFFDFDGTISRSDSLLLFLKFYFPKRRLVRLMSRFMPVYARFKLGLISNSKAKERLFEMAFARENLVEFNDKCRKFYSSVLRFDLKQTALDRVKSHLEKGDRVVLVSASIENYLLLFCNDYNMELISTKLEVEDEKLTGKFETPNCYGPEKVNRIKASIDLSQYEEVFVFGDSRGDREMLELATHRFYREFD